MASDIERARQGKREANTIAGKIAIEGTGVGVPDLLVVIYDIDDDRLINPSDDDVQPPVEKSTGIWNNVVGEGDRLGSILTDLEGRFELHYDDREFRRGARDREERPDLVLFVLGPETTQETDEREIDDVGDGYPRAISLNKQILHYSNITRGEAGETESYIIHLTREQLENAGVVLPGTDAEIPDPEEAASRYVENIDKTSKFRTLVDEGLLEKGLIEAPQERVDRAQENYEKIHKQTRKLTAVPKKLRKSGFFLPGNAGETATATAKNEAREKGFKNLENYRKRVEQDGPLKTYVEPSWFERWDLEPPAEEEEPVEIEKDEKVFCSLLRPSTEGYDLTRVRSLLEHQFTEGEEVAAETTITFEGSPSGEYDFTVSGTLEKSNAMGAWNNSDDVVTESPESGWTASGSVNGGSGRDSYAFTGEILDIEVDPDVTVYLDSEKTDLGGATDVEVEVRQRILGQLSDLATFEDARNGRGEDRLLHLRETLSDLKLTGGPANVTSYHDFRSLQIAFPDVWTEAFDSSIKRDVERLYNTHVELHNEYGTTVPSFVEVGEIQDVNELLDATGRFSDSLTEPVPSIVASFWAEATFETWNLLSPEQQKSLLQLAQGVPDQKAKLTYSWISSPFNKFDSISDLNTPFGVETRRERHEKGLGILANPSGLRSRLIRLMKEVRERLSEPYAFHYFEPDSVNYGLLTTYRQEWQPGPYQVADLVSTIPLAPGETRKYTKKESIKRSRATKEVENALSTRRGESTQTRRAEAEIIEKASQATNFKLTASGSYGKEGVYSIKSASEFASNQARESAQTKKDFREAVVKASHEYKNERTLEVSTTEEFTEESTTSGELSNPNNELTVTYLLYELERQYRITERIHQLTPIILVAQDIPGPHEITESWLLEHEWVLRRVLLDDSFHVALSHLSESFAGDELSLNVKEQNWETQKELVKSLQSSVDAKKELRSNLRRDLIGAEKDLAEKKANEESEGWFSDFADEFKDRDPEEKAIGLADADVEALKMGLEYLDSTIQEVESRLSDEREALNEGTRAYTEALEERSNRRTAIDQLRMHVKENILYYMQAIWDHEPPDQRYFRLYHKEVYVPRAGSVQLTLRKANENESTGTFGLKRFMDLDGEPYVVEAESGPIPAEEGGKNKARLSEIADLDNPLGYKGNYIMFPLKTCTFLTDYMMNEYVDHYFGIHDPDELAEFTSEELRQFIESKRAEITRNEELTEEEIETLEEALGEIIQKRLTSPRRESDLVVVPTGELYMEALLGDQALLEDFKLAHRGYDAAKARADLRQEELENLRYAARLLGEEPDLDDPDADRHVVVEGIDSTALVSTDGNNE